MADVAVVRGLPQPGRTLVMGVVNVTPDSFSDGGEWFDSTAAIRHGLDLIRESMSGGSQPVPALVDRRSLRSCGGCCPWSGSYRLQVRW